MNIGELFINLGIKGSEKTIGAIDSTRKGMSELGSASLQTKVMILGAMYALERMMAQSAGLGTNLSNFNAVTGLSTKSLQEWQYAAQQAGVAGEEVAGSVKSVQDNMGKMLMGKGMPEGFGQVKAAVGLEENKVRDPFYVMKQLQEYAKTVSPDVGNIALKSFGLSEGVIAAMRKNMFREDIFAKAPKYGEGEINQLNKVDVAWKNLGQKVEMAFGHFTAGHGMKMVGDISKITTEVIKLAEAFIKLADKIELFKQIGRVFEGWAEIFKGLESVMKFVEQGLSSDYSENKKSMEKSSEFFGGAKEMGIGISNAIVDKIGLPSMFKIGQDYAAPNVKSSPSNAGTVNNINQNLHFQHDGKDANKNAESHKQGLKQALGQMPRLQHS